MQFFSWVSNFIFIFFLQNFSLCYFYLFSRSTQCILPLFDKEFWLHLHPIWFTKYIHVCCEHFRYEWIPFFTHSDSKTTKKIFLYCLRRALFGMAQTFLYFCNHYIIIFNAFILGMAFTLGVVSYKMGVSDPMVGLLGCTSQILASLLMFFSPYIGKTWPLFAG